MRLVRLITVPFATMVAVHYIGDLLVLVGHPRGDACKLGSSCQTDPHVAVLEWMIAISALCAAVAGFTALFVGLRYALERAAAKPSKASRPTTPERGDTLDRGKPDRRRTMLPRAWIHRQL